MAAGRPREFDYNDALNKAMRVFWQKGYEGTSMPDLTEAMGMNRPSIYAAFGNKEELFTKTLELYMQKSSAALETALSAPKLQDAIANFLNMTANSFSCPESPRGCLAVQGALACSDESENAKQQALTQRETIFTALHKRFKKGLKDGDLPTKTNIEALARFYATVLNGMSIQSASGISRKELQDVAKAALNALPV